MIILRIFFLIIEIFLKKIEIIIDWFYKYVKYIFCVYKEMEIILVCFISG